MSISLLLVAAVATAPCVDLRPAISEAAHLLETRYVSPELGHRAAATLRATPSTKVCGDVDAQAAQLTLLVRDALPDWHIRVSAGSPASHDVPPPVAGDDHGIVEVSRMAGGIGYLRISDFDDIRVTTPLLEHAMRLLANATGIILDVRGNPGGDGDTAELVWRTFQSVGAPPAFDVFDRAGKRVDASPHEPSWPRIHAPVVVLVDRGSASSAEALAYALREETHATIIGTRTLGAAHQVHDAAPLPGGFSISLPEYRMPGHRSGRDWERVGVVPDVQASGHDALLLAWERLRKR